MATLCRVLGVGVSGFHAWLHAVPSVRNRAEAEATLRGHIGRIFAARRRIYGSPRVHAGLRREGRRHGRRRVARLMREMGLPARQGRRPAPRAIDGRHARPPAPDLSARTFTAKLPDRVWLADISCLATVRGLALPGGDQGHGHARGRRLIGFPSHSCEGARPWPGTSGRRCARRPW